MKYVSNFGVHIRSHEHIVGLDIAVHSAQRVHEGQSSRDLICNLLRHSS